jgi:fumarate reductase flavoprotein subunit
VWIDVSHLGAEVVERNFRGMVKRCRDFGRDLAREPVEVGPTTHFMMGGVVIDCQCRTTIDGLFAAGEDAGGVHGANRLGGNGVAESTVFGGIAGDVMADSIIGRRAAAVPASIADATVARATAPLARPAGSGDLYALQRTLRDVMWEQVGLVRDGDGLRDALSVIDAVEMGLADIGVPGGPAFNIAWHDWLNLENQVTVGRLIATSAAERRESRGAHFRRDFPDMDPEGPYVVRVRRQGDAIGVDRMPVAFTRAEPTSTTISAPAD